MTGEDRVSEIGQQITALTSAPLVALLHARMAELTVKLIGANDEQTRGAIKELRHLLNLPEALQAERQGITAELPATDSAS